MALTYLVIEDEAPARDYLIRMVGELAPHCRCLGHAADGLAGLELLRNTPADLVFLDIEFPPQGAFGMLAQARTEGISLPPIIFVTAYDQFAVQAFRWAACDYLMKPLDPTQLKESLQRVPSTVDVGHLQQILAATQQHQAPERFTVRDRGRLRVLWLKDVTHFDTSSRLVFANSPEGRFVVDHSLEDLENLLGTSFFRVHRSTLVNLAAIQELHPDVGHSSRMLLRGGVEVLVSRDRLASLRKRLT